MSQMITNLRNFAWITAASGTHTTPRDHATRGGVDEPREPHRHPEHVEEEGISLPEPERVKPGRGGPTRPTPQPPTPPRRPQRVQRTPQRSQGK